MSRQEISRFWQAREGLGAIELGFIAPVLLTLLLGVLDFGMAFWQQMEIANAADAGAQWGMQNSYDAAYTDTSPSIRTVAQSATNMSTVNVSSINPCGCASDTGVAGGYGNPRDGCSACPDGSTAKTYIVVNTHICYSTLFHWPGLTYCSNADSNCSGCTSTQVALSAQSAVLK